MGFRDWLPFRRRDAAPGPSVGAVARPPEWPRLPPLQRSVAGPSLVTDPEEFRRRLSTWGNPSFLGPPGHLRSPEAPSGSVSGLAVTRTSFDAAAPPAARPEWGSGVSDAAPSRPTTAVQLSAAGTGSAAPGTVRSTPPVVPAAGAVDGFLSAASAPVPPPVPRPAVALTAAPGPPPARPQDGPRGGDAPEPTGGLTVLQRQAATGDVVASPPAGPEPPPGHSSRPPELPDGMPFPLDAADGGPAGPAEPLDPPSAAAETPTLGAAPGTGLTAVHDPAPGSPAPDRAPVGRTPAAVQLLAHDAAAPPGTGRRRLGLGAPLPSTPPPAAPPSTLPPAGPHSSPPPAGPAPVAPLPAAQRMASAATPGPLGAAPVPPAVVPTSADQTSVAEVPPPDAGAPLPPGAASGTVPPESPDVPTLGADVADGILPVAPERDPAGRATASVASVQRTVDPGAEVPRPPGAAALVQRRPASPPPVASAPARSVPMTSPPTPGSLPPVTPRPAVQREGTGPVADRTVAAAPDAGPPAADAGEVTPPSPEVSLAPTVPEGGNPVPLIGDGAPLPAATWSGPAVQRVVGSPPDVAPSPRSPHGGGPAASPGPAAPAPLARSAATPPTDPPAGVATGSAVAALPLPQPEAVVPGGSGSSVAAPVHADTEALPATGSTVGAVGFRPLQRQVAELTAPVPVAHRLPDDGWSAGHGPRDVVQRSTRAPAEAGSRPLAPARMAPPSTLGPPVAGPVATMSRVVPLPPPTPGAWRGGDGPGTTVALPVQTLVSLGDVRPQPTLPASAAALVADAGAPPQAGDGAAALPPLPATAAAPLDAGTGTAAAGVVTGRGAAPAAPVATGDVDALVRRLYDPLARRLRAELRLDRERVGHALDLQH